MKLKKLAFISVFAALYVVITLVMAPISYGPVQFRLSEIIVILPFWNKKFIEPSLLGVFIVALFSPLGIIDVAVGLAIGLITYFIFMNIFKNKIILVTLYSVLTGVLVAAELTFLYQLPFFITALSITASQLIICLIGLFVNNRLMLVLEKRNILSKI